VLGFRLQAMLHLAASGSIHAESHAASRAATAYIVCMLAGLIILAETKQHKPSWNARSKPSYLAPLT
jgi:hypothetical protein